MQLLHFVPSPYDFYWSKWILQSSNQTQHSHHTSNTRNQRRCARLANRARWACRRTAPTRTRCPRAREARRLGGHGRGVRIRGRRGGQHAGRGHVSGHGGRGDAVGGGVRGAEREADGQGLLEIGRVAGAGEARTHGAGGEAALAGHVGGCAARGGDGGQEAGCL